MKIEPALDDIEDSQTYTTRDHRTLSNVLETVREALSEFEGCAELSEREVEGIDEERVWSDIVYGQSFHKGWQSAAEYLSILAEQKLMRITGGEELRFIVISVVCNSGLALREAAEAAFEIEGGTVFDR